MPTNHQGLCLLSGRQPGDTATGIVGFLVVFRKQRTILVPLVLSRHPCRLPLLRLVFRVLDDVIVTQIGHVLVAGTLMGIDVILRGLVPELRIGTRSGEGLIGPVATTRLAESSTGTGTLVIDTIGSFAAHLPFPLNLFHPLAISDVPVDISSGFFHLCCVGKQHVLPFCFAPVVRIHAARTAIFREMIAPGCADTVVPVVLLKGKIIHVLL